MVRFQFSGEPILEWKGNTASPRGRFISYLKARKMIRKGYIYHLVWVQDVKAESPSLQSIPMVNEFVDVFSDELPGLLLERDIEFAIDTLPYSHPISIPLYRMVPAELRELKEQLRDLLEKGFIRPTFLGHIISGEGIRVDTHKIEAMKTWPRPTTPMKALKDILTSAPVLTLPEGTNSYVIYCNASGVGLGGVLMKHDSGGTRVTIQDTTTSSLVTEVKEHQYEDHVLAHYTDTTPQKEKTPFEITGDGVLRYRGRLCVLNVTRLRQQVMGEDHYSRYSIHLGVTEMYHDIRGIYWWDGMKKDIAEFVSHCPNCQQVKIEHQKPGGLLQAIEILTWKWEMAPYEWKCRSHIGWFEIGETKLVGLDLVQHAVEKIKLIRERLLAAQSRQKSYADNRRRDLEFQVADWVFLKCIGDPSKVIPVDDVQVTEQLSYEEDPIAILIDKIGD
ncbi:uncharacterized protein [Nicotiana tomentosiformis]|uniref:uncharacterized protein n=1 Tax=Nicotiana tomentosiformis TaxID=4098 RepID=UPI00388C67DD